MSHAVDRLQMRWQDEVSRAARLEVGAVPVILRAGPYRFHFYSADFPEPPHVHVSRDAKRAKFWLTPVQIAWSRGFTRRELRDILLIIRREQDQLVRSWDEYFQA